MCCNNILNKFAPTFQNLNPLKKLVSQTFIYGIPSIAGRFLFFLLTYLYTRVFSTTDFGVNAELYAYSGFITVLLAFGLETGFFRFQQDSKNPEKVYSTALIFLTLTSLSFLALLMLFVNPLAAAMHYQGSEFYLQIFAFILALDALGSLPFARLRALNKAKQFAVIKVIEIVVSFGLNIFYLIICRKAYLAGDGSFFASCYNPAIGVGYIFIANLAGSIVKLLLLAPQFVWIKEGFDKVLFGKMIRYSLPMVLIGFAGIINEMLDRMSLKYLLPGSIESNLSQLGIYGACYKLSIVMTLFIQAFRYAAEPFFFAQKKEDKSRKIYADVLLYFTIFCVFIFLMVTMFMDYFQLFIGKDFREGLVVVPILLLANMFLGIYTNLSVWYKLTDRTMSGAYLSIAGAVLTIVLLFAFVPQFGYVGAAYATLICYIFMAVVSYILGQKYFPVPYNVLKVLGYIVLGVAVYAVQQKLVKNGVNANLLGVILMTLFAGVVYVLEKRNLISEK